MLRLGKAECTCQHPGRKDNLLRWFICRYLMKGPRTQTWQGGKISRIHWDTLGPKDGNHITTAHWKRAGDIKWSLLGEPAATAIVGDGEEGGWGVKEVGVGRGPLRNIPSTSSPLPILQLPQISPFLSARPKQSPGSRDRTLGWLCTERDREGRARGVDEGDRTTNKQGNHAVIKHNPHHGSGLSLLKCWLLQTQPQR